MALDRQSIEKKDFPVGRRGYDPEAVDAHLSALADEIADLRRTARRRSDTLASSASEQVRSIVEAAENSAADIQRDAENDAREIREEADREAQATRENATEQARDYIGKVSESNNAMLDRLGSMETELGALIESLRTGGNRLSADLQLLEGNLVELRGVVSPRPPFEPEAVAAAEPEAEAATEAAAESGWGPQAMVSEPAPTQEHEAAGEGGESDSAGWSEPAGGEDRSAAADSQSAEPDAAEAAAVSGAAEGDASESAEAQPPGESASSSEDTEGARLIALNMALNGTPREETARYLSENFQLPDAGNLLDEVYASVEG